jgi:hypothetical protein|tara:strand:- start:602 stop:979 length:378 start_codon:yes stop_codon:yes gene_type:complete
VFRKKLGKKAQMSAINDMVPLITSLVAVGIVLVIGFLIMAETKSTIAPCSNSSDAFNGTDNLCYDTTPAGVPLAGTGDSQFVAAYNGTSSTQNAIATIPDFLPIIVITVIGIILLGMVAALRKFQ